MAPFLQPSRNAGGRWCRSGTDADWSAPTRPGPLAERDSYGPDELLANAPRLWPDTTTLPFHYRHPVTGKDFVTDSRGAFREL